MADFDCFARTLEKTFTVGNITKKVYRTSKKSLVLATLESFGVQAPAGNGGFIYWRNDNDFSGFPPSKDDTNFICCGQAGELSLFGGLMGFGSIVPANKDIYISALTNLGTATYKIYIMEFA